MTGVRLDIRPLSCPGTLMWASKHILDTLMVTLPLQR
jgi:hypothetical protein